MIRKNIDDLDENGQKGDWAFVQNDTRIAIRYGDQALTGTVVIPVSGPGAWEWNGSKEAPTLSPSIAVSAYPGWTIGWHGWLRDGKLVNA